MKSLGVLGAVVLGNPEWGGFVIAIAAVFLILLVISSLRMPLPWPWKIGLFLCKAVAVCLLSICLLNPLWTRQYVKPGENIVLLLADSSSSMKIRNGSASEQTRGEWAKEVLSETSSPWQLRLTQDFDLRKYVFSENVSRVENFESITFDGMASELLSSLISLRGRFDRQPLGAVLLFSDGNATDSNLISQLPQNVPVFPVLANEDSSLPDLSIQNVSISQINFEDAPVTVEARIRQNGSEFQAVQVALQPVSETSPSSELQKVELAVQPNQEVLARFQVKPTQVGVLDYRLTVVPADQLDVLEHPQTSRESTLENNQRLLTINRESHVHRVLYLAGRPNWEHKFLSRALEEDSQLHLVSLIRIAKKEAKFDFRGRAGESSNPLFRGFRESPDEETESYDEPVLIRLNTRDALELSQGFPKTRDELYRYEAIIVDDIEAAFFTHDQLTMLERFVAERGGGLLMLGGRDSFQHGRWERTPVADSLPVYFNRPVSPQSPSMQSWQWNLTREGWLEPWMRIRDSEEQEQQRISSMPQFELSQQIWQIKPGAQNLAIVQGYEQRPALVTQQYGRGRTAVLTVGDFWKWSLHRRSSDENDAAVFWRQFSRWLVGDVPKRLNVETAPRVVGNNPVTWVQVRVRDQEFRPDDEARVEVRITQPDGTEVLVDAQPSLEEAGLFEVQHVSRQRGSYHAHVIVRTNEENSKEDNSDLETTVGWSSNPGSHEFDNPDRNTALLRQIAERTGGELIEERDLERFAQVLPTRDLPVSEIETKPLWHRGWLLGLVILLLAMEWGLRRVKGLA